jgi:hypothetical protein
MHDNAMIAVLSITFSLTLFEYDLLACTTHDICTDQNPSIL